MPTITLQHCIPVTIHASDVSTEVDLDLTVGGSASDGSVQIDSTPDPVTPATSLACGAHGVFHSTACKLLKLHYVMSPGGPSSISVTYTVTVP